MNLSNIYRNRSREYFIDDGPIEPLSGGASAIMGTATSMMMGVADMPIQTLKLLNIHPDSRSSKKGKSRATSDDATSVAESSRNGRPASKRTGTNLTDISTDSTTLARSNTSDTAVPSPDTPGTPTHRSTFMSQLESRSPSGDRTRQRASSITTTDTRSTAGTLSPRPATPGQGQGMTMENAVDTGKGLARIIGAGFKSPMDFSLNVAKGLHNVPKLYGADVRQTDKVTDFQSGLRTAAKVRFVICAIW
jgi:hypothetical protein